MSLDPPPSIISKFNHNWIQWLSRVYTEINGSVVHTTGDETIEGEKTFSDAITASTGIYLGGTATANLLDDYEKGTFTPAITFSGTSNATYGTGRQHGSYVKVGRTINIQLNIKFDKNTSTGNAGLNGLPFSRSTTDVTYIGGMLYTPQMGRVGYGTGYYMTSGTTMALTLISEAVGGDAFLTATDIVATGTDAEIRHSFNYETDS